MTNPTLTAWNVIVHGVRFDYLLCTVYATTLLEAKKLAGADVRETFGDDAPTTSYRVDRK